MFQFTNPGDWASGFTLRGTVKFISAVTGNAVMKAAQVSTVPGSTDDDALAFPTPSTSSQIAAPATQGQTVEFTISPATVNMAANRKMCVYIGRDPAHLGDDAAGDLALTALTYEYTTT
jgi:hypothetical protein